MHNTLGSIPGTAYTEHVGAHPYARQGREKQKSVLGYPLLYSEFGASLEAAQDCFKQTRELARALADSVSKKRTRLEVPGKAYNVQFPSQTGCVVLSTLFSKFCFSLANTRIKFGRLRD